MQVVFQILMLLTAVFLILVVLVQRGRGGGLAGAFGGMGGQSAFGTKAGDLFTRITIGVALFWILLCITSIKLLGSKKSILSDSPGRSSISAPAATGEEDDAGGTSASPGSDDE